MARRRYLVHMMEAFSFPDSENPARVVEIKRLHTIGGEPVATDRERGVYGYSVPVNPELLSRVVEVPAWYELDLREVPNRKTSKPELRCVDVRYLEPVGGFEE